MHYGREPFFGRGRGAFLGTKKGMNPLFSGYFYDFLQRVENLGSPAFEGYFFYKLKILCIRLQWLRLHPTGPPT